MHTNQREIVISPVISLDSTHSIPRKPIPTSVGNSEVNKVITRWNLEQAFFAAMGGFSIEIEYLDETNTKVTIRRLVTVDGVLQLAKLGLIPLINPEDIADRSKADDVAKFFILSQIIWFGLQVIERLAADLPVTPLELHTTVHVFCAIAMYLLWIKKPYDVRNSVSLNEPDAKAIAALCNFYRTITELHAKAFAQFETTRINYWRDRAVRAANNLLDHDPPPDPPARESLTLAVERYLSFTEGGLTAITNDHQEQTLAALAPSAKQGIDILQSRGGFTEDSINSRSWALLRENSENFAIKVVWGGWSTNTAHGMSLDKGAHFLFNFLYGGGHLAAWASSSFPTSIEENLWRTSAIMLTSIPIWGSLWILWWKAVNSKTRWLYFIRNGDLDIVVAPLFFVVMLAYFLARCYFLVESLISLRLLPAGAFLTVNWARYLPHVA